MRTHSNHIEDYALIGDMRTGALISRDGSVDWLSLPRFDSAAVHAALLGTDQHGHWSLAPTGDEHHTQRRYRPGTLILETEWITAHGAVRVTDFMDPTSAAPQVFRIVDGLLGTVQMDTSFSPRAGYGHDRPKLGRRGSRLVASSGADAFWMDSDAPLQCVDDSWTGSFPVAAGDHVTFTLSHSTTSPDLRPAVSGLSHGSPSDPTRQLRATDAYWTGWSSRSSYRGPWETEVTQSLVLLKALTYAPTGSILAAATTSLPELVGGTRNWDYRYSWLRDATFSIQAFLAAGYLDEAIAWRSWLIDTIAADPTSLQIMYGIDGTRHLPERTLDWLPGFSGSAPVRIGNAAADQQQNDIYGEVLDTLTAIQNAGAPPATGEDDLRDQLLVAALQTWHEPDHGLWEMRGPRRHFVHSKLMSWVGLDRGITTLENHPRPGTHRRLDELRGLRDTWHQEVLDRGFHSQRRAFTQSYGSAKLDAAVLLMPAYGFMSWTDPHFVTTVEAIQRDLTEHGLVLRYATDAELANVDGVPGIEGVFLATSFWLVDALHEIGRPEEATALFERLLALRNDVGMLAEEYDPRAGHHLGNTPQAFSHAAVVTTAFRLSRNTGQLDQPATAVAVAVAVA